MRYKIILAIPAHAAHRFIEKCTQTTMGIRGKIIPTISIEKIFGAIPAYIQDGSWNLKYEELVGKHNCYISYAAEKYICRDFYVDEELEKFSRLTSETTEGEIVDKFLEVNFYTVNGIPYTLMLAVCKLIDAGITAWVREKTPNRN